MRLLHTSDWHLGRSFHRVSLLEAQRAFLAHLVETVRARAVDAVLVAGDVYDRAIPSLAAVELFDTVLHRLAELGVPVVLISGNHDSARRLGVASGLLGRAGVHLCTAPERCAEPVVLSAGGVQAALYGLPYLEPALSAEAVGAEGRSHAAVLGAAMDAVRADFAERPAGTRSVVLAHAFVTGGEPSDSERDITVGGVAAVPLSVFDGVDYAALGHLHGPQRLSERVRYSGSPLAYSFSEAAYTKSMWLVDLDADGGLHTEQLPLPVPRPLARLRGTLQELLERPELAEHTDSWVEATLTDLHRPDEPMARLAVRFPHVLSLVFDPEGDDPDAHGSYARRVRGRTDREIAEEFVAHVRGGRGPDEAEARVLREAVDAARVATAAQEVD